MDEGMDDMPLIVTYLLDFATLTSTSTLTFFCGVE